MCNLVMLLVSMSPCLLSICDRLRLTDILLLSSLLVFLDGRPNNHSMVCTSIWVEKEEAVDACAGAIRATELLLATITVVDIEFLICSI